jgi:hypothetical protein
VDNRDATPFVRSAVLLRLADVPEVVALIPAERHYPEQRPPNPTWPFLAFGMPITGPFVASGLSGSSISVALHVYGATRGEGDDTVPGADFVKAALAVIVAALGGDEGCALPLDEAPYPATAHLTWTGSQVVQDGSDANAFHGWATFDITVSS